MSIVDYKLISPHKTSPRTEEIDTITIHCVVGQWTVERIGQHFAKPTRNASSNYGVGLDGKIGQYVEEGDRAWTTGGKDRKGKVIYVNGISGSMNDQRAITIEVASDTKKPYAVTDAAYEGLIRLLVDICQRHPLIGRLRWQNDKSLVGQVDKQNMTAHRWFSLKSCPGDYLYDRFGDIAARVNAKLDELEKENKTPVITEEKESLTFSVGDIVNFTGAKQYRSKDEDTYVVANPGRAKITALREDAKHPYHCRAVDTEGKFTRGVFGWVDADDVKSIEPITEEKVEVKEDVSSLVFRKGDIVKISSTAKYISGLRVPAWVRAKTWIVAEDTATDRALINKSTDGKHSINSYIYTTGLTLVSDDVEVVEEEWIPKVGDVVMFNGNVHYANANSLRGTTCRAGKAKITNIKLGNTKHPYHLVRVIGGKSNVYGWVDKDTFSKL